MIRSLLVVSSLLLLPAPAHAQHEHHSPYAGTQSADVPTLTDEEVRQLREGDGMGLARPAELNRYPGPKHLLELEDDLPLSAEQGEAIREIRARMLDAAQAKGAEILQVEAHLAAAFSDTTIDENTLARMTSHLGALRGELQAIHLRAHIESRALLSEAQLDRYDELRGYR